jgi:hypothetical protein
MKAIYMKKALFVLLFIAILPSLSHAEEYKRLTDERRFGIGCNFLGPSIVASLSANYFITSKIKVEAGAGILGYFAGGTYHFGGSRIGKATPYIGSYLSGNSGLFHSETDPFIYLPIGVGGNWKNGLSLHFEFAFFRNMEDNISRLWGAVKFSYYFKK